MVSRSQHVSTSYSCNDPCPPYYQGDLNPFPPPIVLVSGTGDASAWETAIYGSGYSYTWAASAAWTADSSAVSLDPSAAHTTTLTGEFPGSACLTADMGREESYGWDGLNCYDNNNSYPVEGSGCADVGSLVASVVSPSVSADGDAITAGQRFSLRLEVRRADGSRAIEVEGTAAFSVDGNAGSGETIPGGINIVGGAGTADITLQRVLHTGDPGRGYHATLSWGGGSANASGLFNIYFSATMDVERWKNCNFASCPNLGSYFCQTACNANGFAQSTEFIALTASACGEDVAVWNPETARGATSSVRDLGPSTNNAYWLTGNVPDIGGCITDVLATSLGIDNGCNPNHGEGHVLWRFR